MRTLTYFIATTLDGFIAGPDGADPTGPDGFWPIAQEYLGHIVAKFPETLPAAARKALGVTAEGTHFDTVIEGRRSYEIGLAAGVTDAYPHLRHLVCSTTIGTPPDADVEIVDAPLEAVRRLKQQPGLGIWLVGGGDLAATLLPEIDELVLKVSSLTIGTGVPLFGRRAGFEPRSWTLIDSTALDGVCFMSYRRAAADQGSEGLPA
jgi:dihydrofolate reductase